MPRKKTPAPVEIHVSRDITELNKEWAEAGKKALSGDMRELRVRVQLSSMSMGRHIDDSFLYGLNLAIAVASQFDGMPCCVAENLSPKEAKLFNQGQMEATEFVSDYLKIVRHRYITGLSIAAAEKILREYLGKNEGNEK